MSDRLTVAVPADLVAAVARICVELGIADTAEHLPAPQWRGHGADYMAMSGVETDERVGALLAAAAEAGLPLIVLGGDPPPGPGAILAARGEDALAVLAELGLAPAGDAI